MEYIDSGIDLCPILTKLNVGGDGDHSILCRCNHNGTFSYRYVSDNINSDGGVCTFIKETYTAPDLTTYTDLDPTIDLTPDLTTYNCNFWDFTNERCSLKTTDYLKNPDTEEDNLMIQLEKVIGKTSERDEDNSLTIFLQKIIGILDEKDNDNSLLVYLKNILGNNSEKGSAEGTGSSLLKEINHMHGAHWHPSPHECHHIPVSCGHSNPGFATFGTPYATVLIAEYMSNQDLDNNGFIYGRDFMIANSYDKPIMLKPIELTQEWVDPDIVIEWQSILEWSKAREPNDEYDELTYAPDPLDPYR